MARDADARDRRAEVLAIPASLTSLQACLEAADHLVGAAEAESAALSADLDADETGACRSRSAPAPPARASPHPSAVRPGHCAISRRRQKSRATRTQRDALDRALVDLAAFYRDVLLRLAGSAVAPTHPDFAADIATVAQRVDAAGALRCLNAVLGCREALELNVKPRIAVEAMTAATATARAGGAPRV